MRIEYRSIVVLIAAAVLLSATALSCGAKPLVTAGNVTYWAPRHDEALFETARGFPSLRLTEWDPSIGWLTAMEDRATGPDLILAEWGRDLVYAAREGMILDLRPYGNALRAPGDAPTWAFDGKSSPASLMVPATVSLWGLVYNEKILEDAGVRPPDDWASFLATLKWVKASGIPPIALGASFGWPAGAWLAFIDMRTNGGEAYAKLTRGERAFDAPSLITALKTLETWRDLGYFAMGAGTDNWPEALAAVMDGRAAFTLVPASAWPRVANREGAAFMTVPAGKGARGPRGELATVMGFAVRAGAEAPEAALSLALAYARAGAPGLVGDAFRVPVYSREATDGEPEEPSGIKAIEAKALREAVWVAPQLDRILTAQESYEFNRLLAGFFDLDTRESAESLAERLAKAIKGAE